MQTQFEPISGHPARRQIVVNLRTGAREEQVIENHSADSELLLFQPLSDHRLAGTIQNKDTHLLDTVILAAMPDYRETARASIHSSDRIHKDTDIVASNDRKRL
ncbi:MAG TPA: hypothetical protein VG273_19300 [Bryobacteraceae bacterium]|nr:hypothetical protein [Bryobacteraceae bacterium]